MTMSTITDRPQNRAWVHPGDKLRITLDVEVLSVDRKGKVNLRVGAATAECVEQPQESIEEES